MNVSVVSFAKANKLTPLDLINTAARDVAKARAAVARKAQPALDKITALGVKFAALAKGDIDRMQSAEQKLFDLVKQADCEFVKPKSLDVLGVKFGFRQQPDVIEVGETAVDLIIERLDAERFVRTKVEANVEALETLSDEVLQQVDCVRLKGDNTAFVSGEKALKENLKALGIHLAKIGD